MKREFLTYEQSIDMRAIGFNEPCLAYYDKDGDFLGDISVNEDTDNLYTNADFVMYQDFKVADVSAPTFSQAFRWLYQKLDIERGIMPLDIESQQLLLKELIDKVSSKHLLV